MNEVDTEQGTSAYLGKPIKTLQMWRYRGEGPPYVKVGSHIRYRKADIDAWLEANTVRPRGAA